MHAHSTHSCHDRYLFEEESVLGLELIVRNTYVALSPFHIFNTTISIYVSVKCMAWDIIN